MATTSTFRRRRNLLGLNHYEALELIGSAYKDTKMIEWEYYNAADYDTNQKLAQRAQIVADALDEGLRVERQPAAGNTNYWSSSSNSVGCAAWEDFNIRIGREVPELECWARVCDGVVITADKHKMFIEGACKEFGGECVRFVPEGK